MKVTATDRNALKAVLKEVLMETLDENREVLHDIFAEVLEDFVQTQVIRDGEHVKSLKKGDVFPVVEGKA